MSILEVFSRKTSTPRQPAQCGEALIVRKQANTRASIIEVGVRIEDGPPAWDAKLERPAIVELSDELRRRYLRGRIWPSRWKITGYFYGLGMDAVCHYSYLYLEPETHRRLKDGNITFTRFVGVNLGLDWEGASQLAVALACFHALGDPPLTRKLEMGEWKEI